MDELFAAANIAPPTSHLLALSHDGYDTNLPVADLVPLHGFLSPTGAVPETTGRLHISYGLVVLLRVYPVACNSPRLPSSARARGAKQARVGLFTRTRDVAPRALAALDIDNRLTERT